MRGIGQELRHAARRLARSPTFALASILTLALAIGANASIFAVVQRVVLNPLPYPDSDRVIRLDHAVPRMNIPSFESMPIGVYFQYADRAQTLAAVGTYRSDELTLTGGGDPVRIRVAWVTPSLSEILRVSPGLGRWFTGREGAPGAPQVAVVSHGLWVRRYGSDPTVMGRSVRLSGVPTEIIGVMPASYAFPDPRTDVWLPDQITRAGGFGIYTHTGVARLRDGVEAQLTAIAPDARVYGADAARLPNTLCIGMPGVPAATQVMALDLAGVMVSAGAACSSGKVRPSRVLAAMGATPEEAQGAIRISLGWSTGAAEIERLTEAWAALYRRTRAEAA